MKKILALILVLASAFTLFSCGESRDIVKRVNKMYTSLVPTKIVTETTQDIGAHVLTGEYVLTMGTIDGNAVTTLYYSYQQLRSIEDGAGSTVELPWEDVTLTKEYHEEKGVRENGGKWDKEAEDFAPTVEDIALKISAKHVEEVTEDEKTKTITFIVPKDNTADVFGEENAIEADVQVTIVHDGAAIMSVTLSYTVPAAKKDYPDIVTVIKTTYSYEPQEITIN